MIADLNEKAGRALAVELNSGSPANGAVFVTRVNYTGYFVCVKHFAPIMKLQQRFAPGRLTEIVQVNSKPGLGGSHRNSAYAGSKLGSIGLTQSFAKELVEHGIKVNSVCPGNFFEGPDG